MKLSRFVLFCLLSLPLSVGAIEVPDSHVVSGSVSGSQKIVAVLDDSHSMQSFRVDSPIYGNNILGWNYFEEVLKDLFKHVENVDFAITRIHAPFDDDAPEEYVTSDGDLLNGLAEGGGPSERLENALDNIFGKSTIDGTPLRVPVSLAGRFLLCSPGSENLLGRGLITDLEDGTAIKYPCWNTVNFTLPENKDAQSCTKHALWVFTDGFYYSARWNSFIKNEEITQLFDSYLGRKITKNYDGISNYPDDGYHFTIDETTNAQKVHHTDLVGLSDVLKYIGDIAEERNYNLEVNFVLLTDPEDRHVYFADSDYSLDGLTGTDNPQSLSMELLDHICATRLGLSSCNPAAASAGVNPWDWLGWHFNGGEPYFMVDSPVTTIFDFNGDDYTTDDTTPWNYNMGFDTILGLRHLDEKGQLGSVLIDDHLAFERQLPELISRVRSPTVARSSLAGVAVNGTETKPTDRVYQPWFAENVGDVLSLEVTSSGLEKDTSAAENMTVGYVRNVWTIDLTADARTPFKLPDAAAPETEWDAFKSSFTSDELALATAQERGLWLINSENANPAALRPLRTAFGSDGSVNFVTVPDLPTLIGDIVNSKPLHVGEAFFASRSTSKGAYSSDATIPYSDFKASVSSREAVLYTGSNAGALHGFDATTMEEKFAYMPSGELLRRETFTGTESVPGDPSLGTIQQLDYSHLFGVDATPTVQDVIATMPNCTSSSRCWRTVLGSGLGRGGRGVFMLDVTDPTVFETDAAAGRNAVLWEYGTADALGDELGLSYSRPAIFASHWQTNDTLAKPRWTMVFGNGLNSPSKKAYLYVLAIDKPTTARQNWIEHLPASSGNVVRIELPTATPVTENGALSPVAVDLNADDIIDYYYVGDMNGNVHRVNVTDPDPVNWFADQIFDSGVDSTNYAVVNKPVVVTADGNRGGVMVVFAQGHVFNPQSLVDYSVKGVFGIWDKTPGAADGTTIAIKETDLQFQYFTHVSFGVQYRYFDPTETKAPDYATQKGWKVSLLSKSLPVVAGSEAGERVTDMVFHQGLVVAASHEVLVDSSQTAGTCEVQPYTGYISLFDANSGGADIKLTRFMAPNGLTVDGTAPFVITSVKLKDAPGGITTTGGETFYTQAGGGNDGSGNTPHISELEGETGTGLSETRLSWTRIKQ